MLGQTSNITWAPWDLVKYCNDDYGLFFAGDGFSSTGFVRFRGFICILIRVTRCPDEGRGFCREIPTRELDIIDAVVQSPNLEWHCIWGGELTPTSSFSIFVRSEAEGSGYSILVLEQERGQRGIGPGLLERRFQIQNTTLTRESCLSVFGNCRPLLFQVECTGF